MTNAHVVTDVSDLTATFYDGAEASATVVGSRSDKDVAVVKVKISDLSDSTLSSIAVATLNTDTESLQVGQPVVAIGNALGEGQSVTSGIISALGRSITVNNYTYDDLIMTDAAINSGNSGGALLNAEGEVIGINFAKSDDDGVQNMAYSIPVGDVIDLVESMSTNTTREEVDESERGFLGVSGVDITSDISSAYGYPQGLMIRYVQSGSAADNAGLAEYDIITALDDQTVSSQSGLSNILKYYRAGETVTITYYHLENNQYVEKSVEVTLGSKTSS
jgi:serine protease Do